MHSGITRGLVFGVGIVVALVASRGDVARADDGSCAGTVVNLSCDTVRLPGATARCDGGEQVFALEVDGRSGLQALALASGPASLDRLRSGAFTGRQVRVVGSCPERGVIRVDDVVPLG